MPNRSQRLRTPEQQAARRERKKHAHTARQVPPAQMTHGSSGKAKKKRREGERAAERDRS